MTTSKQQQFWNWFQANEPALYQAHEEDTALFAQLMEALKEVHPDLTFEFGASDQESTRIFCISADGIKSAFPEVIELVKVAPELDGWKIKAFRQRIYRGEISIGLGDIELSYQDIFFKVTPQAFDGKLNIQLFVRHLEPTNTYTNAIFILLDALLGEYDVATQLHAISWSELTSKALEEEDLLPFAQLREVVDLAKALKN